MKVSDITIEDSVRWNRYVESHPKAEIYHRFEWRQFFESVYKTRCFYLAAIDNAGNLAGVLPLVFLKSRIFGRSLVSIPAFNYCGILSSNVEAQSALIETAKGILEETNGSHIELRHYVGNEIPLPSKTSKVSMRLDLPSDTDELFSSFPAKLRSQIRRPEKDGATVKEGGTELLEEFYSVFSRNMRDLGTPVFPREFFTSIFELFPESSRAFVVHLEGQAVAAGYTLGFRDRLEIPSASSLRKFSRSAPNMLLYWTVLKYAVAAGYRQFDFGRSTEGTGPWKFKKQWGATPRKLEWHYVTEEGKNLPNISPQNSKYSAAVNVWKHLPLGIANRLGPYLVRQLP